MRRTITGTLLFSSLLFTAAAYASPPSGDSSASARRVSTGIVPPKLLDSLSINLPDQTAGTNIPAGTQIRVAFVVDEKGQPHDIRVVQGYDLIWNARAVDAVSKLHYRPASLDNQSIPMNMNLVITLAQ
jgi:Gram-negative bacterial TonB protein C-terminal